MATVISSIEQLAVGDVVFIDGYTPELVTKSVQRMTGDPDSDAVTDDGADSLMKIKPEVTQLTYSTPTDKYPSDMIYRVLGMDSPKVLLQSHPDTMGGVSVTRVVDIRRVNLTKTSIAFASLVVDAFYNTENSNRSAVIERAMETVVATGMAKGASPKNGSKTDSLNAFIEKLTTSLSGTGMTATVIPLPPKDETTEAPKVTKARKPRKSKNQDSLPENTDNKQV